MKKITVLVAMALMSCAAQASKLANRFNFNEPIQFNERGIDFFVFPNGEFDFNTRPNDSNGNFFYKTAGRRATITIASQNFGTLIEQDNFGRVRRVGNTFINYDMQDRVSRIGSVYMRYNRFALIQIGGLRLMYNRYGELVNTFGAVKRFANQGFTNGFAHCGNGAYYGPNNNNNNNGFNNNNSSNNNDFETGNSSEYYYKQGTRSHSKDSIVPQVRGNRR